MDTIAFKILYTSKWIPFFFFECFYCHSIGSISIILNKKKSRRINPGGFLKLALYFAAEVLAASDGVLLKIKKKPKLCQ